MLTIDYIGGKVNSIIKKYGTRDPFEICDDMQIGLRYRDLGEQMKAFFFYHSRIKTIVLNTRCDEALQRVLCAHELGHAVLHTGLARTNFALEDSDLFCAAGNTEYEANIFASQLLIDDDELIELCGVSGYSLFEAAAILKMPFELLDFKLKIMKKRGHNIEPLYLSSADFLKSI